MSYLCWDRWCPAVGFEHLPIANGQRSFIVEGLKASQSLSYSVILRAIEDKRLFADSEESTRIVLPGVARPGAPVLSLTDDKKSVKVAWCVPVHTKCEVARHQLLQLSFDTNQQTWGDVQSVDDASARAFIIDLPPAHDPATSPVFAPVRAELSMIGFSEWSEPSRPAGGLQSQLVGGARGLSPRHAMRHLKENEEAASRRQEMMTGGHRRHHQEAGSSRPAALKASEANAAVGEARTGGS